MGLWASGWASGERERHNVDCHKSRGQNIAVMFGLQLPLTRKPWVTFSNPCNKVRGTNIFLKKSFCLYHCVDMYPVYIYIYMYISAWISRWQYNSKIKRRYLSFFGIVRFGYSYGPPHITEQKQDDHLEHTYSSNVRIWDVALKTYQRRWTIGRSG